MNVTVLGQGKNVGGQIPCSRAGKWEGVTIYIYIYTLGEGLVPNQYLIILRKYQVSKFKDNVH